MTQEEKDILYTDLCARLPFKIKVEAKGLLKTFADEYDDKDIINAHVLNGLNLRDYFKTYSIDCSEKVPLFNRRGDCNIKPYLFPLSSMTDEQREELKREYCNIACDNIKKMFANPDEAHLYSSKSSSFEIDYFNKHHIDYRGLIPKGLAIDATGLNIY